MVGFKNQGFYNDEEEEEDYNEDDYDSDDDDEEENEPSKEPHKDAVYNTVGLHEKLEEIGWPENIEWIYKLCIDYQREGEIDANDDLAREMTFYTQALEGTREAYGKLQATGIPFLRPEDYYAEMVKSDTHMLKVKDKLLFQKQKMEEAEERRKAREAKKLSKAVHVAKLKERAKQKKQDIESVKKWRKTRQNSGFTAGKDEMPLDLDGGEGGKSGVFQRDRKMKPGVSPGDRSGGKGKMMGFKGGKKGGKSREVRNVKYGHGGPKTFKKQNTAESAADFSEFKSGGKQRKKRKTRST